MASIDLLTAFKQAATASKSYIDGLLKSYVKTSDVPTKTSELTNDSGFLTDADIPSSAGWTANQIGKLKTVLYCMEFSTEEKAEAGKTAIDALIASLAGSADTDTITVEQNGTTVTISGFTASSVSQTGSTLTIV